MKLELSGCIILKEKSVLLLKRIDQQHWEIPGGKLKENETSEKTALREAEEETGCKVKIIKYMGNFDMYIPKKEITTKSYYFLAEIVEGIPHITEPNIFEEIKFVKFFDLKNLNLAPNIKQIINGELKGFKLK